MFCILSALVGKPGKNEERKHSSLLSRIHNKAFITNNKGLGVSLIGGILIQHVQSSGPYIQSHKEESRKANCQSYSKQRVSPAVWFGRPQRWRGAQPLGKGMGAAGRGAQLLSCRRLSWPHSSWVVLLTTCPWGTTEN